MGLFARLFGREDSDGVTAGKAAMNAGTANDAVGVAGAVSDAAASGAEPASPDPAEWVDVPPFLDLEPGEERTLVSVIASAIAAGDNPNTDVEIRRVARENPEYRRVSLIAAAIAAGDRPDASFTCVSVRRHTTPGEESHAA
jgi:hypothetical protein